MKLHWSPRSPFVRKVLIAVHEIGLQSRITCVRTVVAVTAPHADLMQENPLSKLPTLVLDDGTAVYDSPVICEYLDTLHAGAKLFPAKFPERLTALRRQALGDGMLDFLLLWLGERNRPPECQSPSHLAAYRAKLGACLAVLERDAGALAAAPFGIGQIAVGSALCYLDFRFQAEDWRRHCPLLARWHENFAARASVRATAPVDDTAAPVEPPAIVAPPAQFTSR
jgi:glutathione S-transferase